MDSVISALNQMSELYLTCGDDYRSQAYFMAALNVKKYISENIKSGKDPQNLSAVPGVGISIREFINEINRGDMRRLTTLTKTANIYRELGGIFGAGPITIKKWIDLGITNINKLRAAVKKGAVELNKMQRLGLLYYDDLNTPIPREEVGEIGNLLAEVAPCIVAGSYRRGRPYSNDIDVLMMVPAAQITPQLHIKFDILGIFGGKERIMTLINYCGICRHVDIEIAEDLPCALLYFTGDYRYNIMMRARAKSLGYKLNQRGLFGPDGKKFHLKSEHEIFKKLGLPYKEPADRVIKV